LCRRYDFRMYRDLSVVEYIKCRMFVNGTVAFVTDLDDDVPRQRTGTHCRVFVDEDRPLERD
jgi:hypothetical protein